MDQLEKTQKSNGVVQDDPETILRLMEKVDVMFAKIKVSPPETAKVYGQTLSFIVRDLIPAKDVLTKVIKELIISQPHIDVVAQILHQVRTSDYLYEGLSLKLQLFFQVFRSSIDAAYLPLLQDWLVSSVNNFLVLPETKAVWCLTVIFVSASLNVHLLKIFPHVLQLGRGDKSENEEWLLVYFTIAAKDFYNKLCPAQRKMFVDCFMKSSHTIMVSLGKLLTED